MLNEEPYALIAHVRFRGGAWGVIPVSTREIQSEETANRTDREGKEAEI